MVRSEVRDQRSEIRDQRSEGKKFIFWVFSGKDVDCLSWNPAFYQFLDFGKLNPDVILRICIRSLSQNPMQCWFRCFHHRRPEVRDQRSEIRGQRSEVRDQRSEIRGQRSEVRDQRSEIRGQRSEGKKFIFWVFSGKDVDCLSWNLTYGQLHCL